MENTKNSLTKTYSVRIDGGEEIHLTLELEGKSIKSQSWQIVGSLALLNAISEIYKKNTKNINDFDIPKGRTPSELLLKQLLLKVKNLWKEKPGDLEICHCRKISLSAIDRAICLGAHSLEKVRKRTSANTGCGACMADVQELIDRRVGENDRAS